jgi:hypothetical protein
VAQWGEALPAFLLASAQLQDEPYLADVARAEWALHQCTSAANAQADLSTLALLTTQDPAELGFGLAPGCAVLQSTWPLASLLSAHLYPNLSQTPSFATVGQQLRDAVAQDVVVWRAGLRPLVREAAPGEAAFVAELLQGRPLAQALDTAAALDFSTWLPAAIQSGLVLYITQIPP